MATCIDPPGVGRIPGERLHTNSVPPCLSCSPPPNKSFNEPNSMPACTSLLTTANPQPFQIDLTSDIASLSLLGAFDALA